jgi:hypothetical protein
MTSPSGKGVQPVLVSSYDAFVASKKRGADPAAGAAFDPSSSPLHQRAVFVIGAPRSGTTWLQQLLLLHPSIATAGEMHVFCEGLGAVFDNYEGDDPYSGLSGWVTRAELVSGIREFVDGLMMTLRDTMRPDATHVLDKTPNHVPYAARVREVYPDAAFIQIIRDGRDSVASAHDLWSWSADYGAISTVAARWRDAVLDCRQHLSDVRYHEVRYEDLLADTATHLGRIYDVIGLPHDDDFLARSVDFGKTPLNLKPSRSDVGARKWADMPIETEREIYTVAGDLLVDLGYVDAERVRTVLAHRSLRRSARESAELAGKAARRARAIAAARRPGARKPTASGVVRQSAQAVVDAIVAAAPGQAEQRLAADVELTDGGTGERGAAAVSKRLVELCNGGRMLGLDADDAAAAVRWADTPGGVTMLRLAVDRSGKVTSVTVIR